MSRGWVVTVTFNRSTIQGCDSDRYFRNLVVTEPT